MSGMPWWLQAYILVAAFGFGLMLGQPQTDRSRMPLALNLFWSAVLGALWPITACVVVGAAIGEYAEDNKR